MSNIQFILKNQGHLKKFFPFVYFKANFITRLTPHLGHARFLANSDEGIHILCNKKCSMHSRKFRIPSKVVTVRGNFAFILDVTNNNVLRFDLLGDTGIITEVPHSENTIQCVASMCGDYILGCGETGSWISKWNHEKQNFTDLQYCGPSKFPSLSLLVGLGNRKFLTVTGVNTGTLTLQVWQLDERNLYATAMEDFVSVEQTFQVLGINDEEIIMCLNNQLIILDYALGILDQRQQRFSKYHNFQIKNIQKYNEFIVVGHNQGYQIISIETGQVLHQYYESNIEFRMIPSDRLPYFEILIEQLHSNIYEIQLRDLLRRISSS